MPASFHWGNCGEHQRTDHNGLAVAGSKIGAAAGATAATYSPGYTLSDWALTGAIVFTVVQMFTVRLKNWGDWSAWWSARMGNAKRLWTWIRRPG